MASCLIIIGIFFNFLGTLAFARGLFVSKKDALKLGVSRWSSNNDEDNYKLPAVADRLKQRKWGIVGAILMFIGSTLQILGLLYEN
ncbi:MAG: hypothetical protein ACOC1P_06190 [Minisyncoccales bacterium]